MPLYLSLIALELDLVYVDISVIINDFVLILTHRFCNYLIIRPFTVCNIKLSFHLFKK